MIIGTSIWPSKEEWKDKILFLETSEDEVAPDFIEYYLRNLIAQGIIDEISGIMIGKPQNETYYEEYKEKCIYMLSDKIFTNNVLGKDGAGMLAEEY